MPEKSEPTDKAAGLVRPYQPTPYEQGLFEAYRSKAKHKPDAPRIKLDHKAGVHTIALDHPEPGIGSLRLMEALGIEDTDFLNGFLGQLVNAVTQGKTPNEADVNFTL